LILSNVFSVISDVVLSEAQIVSAVISFILSIGYGVVLIIISKTNRKFLISGLLIFAANVINLIATLVLEASTGMTIFATIIVLIISLVAEYHEFMGHSDVLMSYENDLCDKWIKIWNWYIISLIISLVCALLGMAIIVMIASVVNLVVGVLKIIYLYQTAEVYRQYYWFNE